MDFSKHIQKAEEALRRRNPEFAAELFRQLVDLAPDLGEARSGLRRALLAREQGRKGGRLLRKVSGALPLSRAKTYARLGKHAACARALEDYLATNPRDEEANLLLGSSLEAEGHFDSARAVYEFLAEVSPRNPEALKRAGAMMHRASRHGPALAYYERALEADPRDREALKARKDLAADMALARSEDRSITHSRDLMRDAEGARGRERAGRLHRSEEELRGELAALEDRFADSPSDPELMVSMADVHERLGDPEAALELLQRALEYRRDAFEWLVRAGDLEAEALERRAAAADEAGRPDEAAALERTRVERELANHRRRVELRPGDPVQRLGLARRLLHAGEVDGALAELQGCQNEPRVRGEALYLLGRCFQEKGVTDLAQKEYERALETTEPTDERAKEILYNLGTIAEGRGDSEGARSCYIRIYEVDIGFRDVAAKMETFQ